MFWGLGKGGTEARSRTTKREKDKERDEEMKGKTEEREEISSSTVSFVCASVHSAMG